MGLNEIYTVVRGNILMMNPLPSIAQGFSILIQEEKQREVRPPNHSLVESTLNAAVYNNGKNNFRINYAQQTNASTSSSNGGSANHSSHKPHTNRLSHLFCDYCKKSRHIREKCYRFHGFPADFKFTKGRNVGLTTNVLGVGSETDHNYQQHQGQNLTKEQHIQLLQLLKKF
ncbi:hypothetical protein EJD97_013605 [Solanum chilense]|uniref:Uncharacterized protein n=1 Tax=Solanum chilense TaxID=4083 RepID=A0A6N2C9L3_SOLCI|nr:hypothetical protein EJD97_013605 [Solanum chilense]